MRRFFKQKIIDPIGKLLRQGISPEQIALGVAVSLVISIFPVIGATTLMCAVVAIVLRLNLPAMQIVNYMAYPLQIALLIPFFHFGALLFGVEPLPLSGSELVAMFRADFWAAIEQLWDTTMRAIVAWCIICLPAIAALYYGLKPLFKGMKRLDQQRGKT